MMGTIKKTELSLYIDGSKIIFECYGDINNACATSEAALNPNQGANFVSGSIAQVS